MKQTKFKIDFENLAPAEVATAKVGRPRKGPKIPRGAIDKQNEAFEEAVAKRDKECRLPDSAIELPDKISNIQKLEVAIASRNAPIVKRAYNARTGLILDTLANGILQVHVPKGVRGTKYHSIIGSRLFPDKYDITQEEVTKVKLVKETKIIHGVETEIKINREVTETVTIVTRK